MLRLPSAHHFFYSHVMLSRHCMIKRIISVVQRPSVGEIISLYQLLFLRSAPAEKTRESFELQEVLCFELAIISMVHIIAFPYKVYDIRTNPQSGCFLPRRPLGMASCARRFESLGPNQIHCSGILLDTCRQSTQDGRIFGVGSDSDSLSAI